MSRPEWNNGIVIKKLNGAYKLAVGNSELDENGLIKMLEAIGTP